MKLLKIMKDVLYEEISKPSKKDIEDHKKDKPNAGKLYYVVKSLSGKRLGYIDKSYVKQLSKKEGKKYTPKSAAKRRLSQIEYFKNDK